MKYSDQQRVRKIYENAVKLYNYVEKENIHKEDLLEEYSLQWLVTTPLYNIGEHVYNLSTQYKEEHDDIRWRMIAGLRHRLVHDYDGIDWTIISDVIFNEIPSLIKQLEPLL